MKYDEISCKFNMDIGCVELLLRDGRKIFALVMSSICYLVLPDQF